MSVAELAELIGQTGWVSTDAGKFPVEIVDAREMFGRTDVKVRPAGLEDEGADVEGTWVGHSRVQLDPPF